MVTFLAPLIEHQHKDSEKTEGRVAMAGGLVEEYRGSVSPGLRIPAMELIFAGLPSPSEFWKP